MDVKVSLKLPFLGEVAGTWTPDESERKASWEMYVEVVTRISITDLKPADGLLREALSSLYSLFDITRKILRQYGPVVAQPKGPDNLSFGYLAVAVLNAVLRPVLAEWHPLLLDYESRKPSSISTVAWETQWEKSVQLRAALSEVRRNLIDYANLLSEVAEVPSLILTEPN